MTQITYDQYRVMLPVQKHRLDDELEIQPSMMERISAEVVARNSRMIEAKDALQRKEGALADDFKDDEPKLSISAVNAKVARHPERMRLWETYQKARSEYELWSGLLDAWRQRGYTIKVLADLYQSQYYSLNYHQDRDHLDSSKRYAPRVKDAQQDEVRARMRQAGARGTTVTETTTEERTVQPRRRALI